MSSAVLSPTLTGEEIVALCRRHTIFEWSAQAKVDPIPVGARRRASTSGRPRASATSTSTASSCARTSATAHPRVIEAIQEQAATLCYANPFMATEPRARLGAKLAEITPGDIDTFFFTNGGAEANENAISIARVVTGRQKILARYRSYHGGTRRRDDADRRPAALGGRARHGRRRPHPRLPQVGAEGPGAGGRRPARHRGGDPLRGRRRRSPRSSSRPSWARTASSSRPTATCRACAQICDRHGILLIVDEVMAGFGRTGQVVRGRPLGRRARPHHHGQGPDLGLRAARRGGHAPADRARLPGERLLRRPHLQQPPPGLRHGARHDRGLRGREGSSRRASGWAA